jgi:hypothetical protein
MIPEVATPKGWSPEEMEDLSQPLEKPFDFLEEEDPDKKPSLTGTASQAKARSQITMKFDILLATNIKPFDHIASVPTEFYAELKPRPENRFVPSKPYPYRTGAPIVPRRPAPPSIGYRAMRDAVLPTLPKDDA